MDSSSASSSTSAVGIATTPPPLFLDLTLAPYTFISPKIEPKLEPLDEEEEDQRPLSLFPPPPGFGGGGGEEDPTPLRRLSPTPAEADLLSRFYPHPVKRPRPDSPPTSFTSTSTAVAAATSNSAPLVVETWALVPAQPELGLFSALVTSPKKRKPLPPRSAEMVRVSSLDERDHRYFRNVVRKTRATYESLRVLLLLEGNKAAAAAGHPKSRADLLAATLITNRGLSLNRDKRIIGSIPGVYVGDIFFFRMELCVIGLHGQTQAGIDSVAASRTPSGEPIATSIVVSGGYEDDEDTGNVIVYTGHGGKIRHNLKHCIHQKLEAGNLALERSMNYGIEIRVIRGFKFTGSPSGKIYVYDGLYRVVDFWQDVGKSGFAVYKYKLVRIAGQEEMGSALLKLAQEMKEKLLTTMPQGYLSHDISMGKENIQVPVFNDIDDDQYPMHFEYLARPVYPPSIFSQRALGIGGGCHCVTGCSENCSCAEKNGCEFAYDMSGILLMGKPLIYECGSSCRCPPSCRNRVSQKGVRNRLEVFRSRETGWGVRSLDLIRAGAFICEFSGVVLTKEQSELVSMNGDSLIHPNRFPNRWYEWGDISEVIPEHPRPMFPSLPQLSFSIDVSRTRNVACYLSHSCSPNVFVQFVLYDHYDVSYPHLMIFAMENIPPMKELSIDYGVGDELVAKASP